MSTTIDNMVVELGFEGEEFERGIKASLKSLQTLKEGLELDKAVDSLKSLEDTANSINFSGMEQSLNSLANRFSFVGEKIREFENTLFRVAKTGVKTSFDTLFGQTSQGMSKYETETRAIATIRNALPELDNEAGTKKIYEVLKDLQWYSDQTSYSYSEMIDNMAKFTSAGVHDLGQAEKAMEGVANWAAKAGVTAQDPRFHRAFYNISQAMGAQVFKQIDWKSIKEANMATEDVHQQLIETAADMGLLVEASGNYYATVKDGKKLKNPILVDAKNLASTLETGWLTSDVFVKTMEKYADRSTTFGQKAFEAAQKARTFTDAIEAAKDATASGWARSFKIIFGDIDQATELWTNMADALMAVSETASGIRNRILEVWATSGGRTALINAFSNMWNILRGIGDSILTAFGLNNQDLLGVFGEHLAVLSKQFEDATASVLGLFEAFTVLTGGKAESDTSKTTTKLTGDMADLQQHALASAEAVRGMINTGSVKMKPKTVENFEALAAAYEDLSAYLESGEATAEGLADRMAKIEELNSQAAKTNKLMRSKQKALALMKRELKDYAGISLDTVEISKSTAEEIAAQEETIVYTSTGLATIIGGIKDFVGIFTDIIGALGKGALKALGFFKPVIDSLYIAAVGLGAFFTILRGSLKNGNVFSGLINRIGTALAPLGDKLNELAKSFRKFIASGEASEKLKNIGKGIGDFAGFAFDSFIKLIGVLAQFATDFIYPILESAGKAVLTFFSGLGKAISSLVEKAKSMKLLEKASGYIESLMASIKNSIVSNPAFQQASRIFTNFFSLFERDPKLAYRYLKNLAKGLLEPIKNSEFYKEASAKISGFVENLRKTWLESGRLRRAGAIVSTFFTLLKRDPKLAAQYLKNVAKGFIDTIKNSEQYKKVADRVTNFAQAVRKVFIESGRLKRVTSVVSTFFTLLKRDPKVAVQYLKNIGNSLLEPVKNSKLYKTVSPYIINFASAIKKAVTESEGFKKAKTVANTFFTLLKRDPKVALQYLKGVGQSILDTVKNSALFKSVVAPIQVFWDSFKNSWLVTRLTEDFRSLAESLQNGSFSFDMVKEKAVAFFEDLKAYFSSLTLDKVVDGITTSLANLKQQLEERGVFDSFKDQLKGGLIGLFFPASAAAEGAEEGKRQVEQFGPFLKEGIKESLIEGMKPLANTSPFAKQVYDALFPGHEMDMLGQGVADTQTTLEEQTESLSSSIVSKIKTVASQVYEQLKIEISAFLPKLQSDLATIFKGADVGETFKNFALGIAALQGGRWINSLRKINKVGGKNLTLLTKALKRSVINTGDGAKSMFTNIGEGIKSMFTDTGESVKTFTGNLGDLISKANKKHDTFGTALLKIASAIALIAGAIWLISQIDPQQLENSLKAMGIALAGIFVFMLLMKGLHMETMAASMKSIGIGMLGLAVSMRILVGVIKALSGMKPEDFATGFRRLAVMLIGLAVFLNLVKDRASNGKTATSNLKGLIGMAIAIRLLVWSLESLAAMDTKAMVQGLVGLGVLMLELGLFMVLTKDRASDGKTATGNLKGLIGMAIAIRLLVWSLQVLADLSVGQLIKGIIGLGAVMLEMALFSKSLGKSSIKDSIKIVALAFALNALIKPVSKLGSMKTGQLIKGVGALTVIMLAMAFFMKATSTGGIKDAIGSMISMATLAGVMWIFFQGLEKAAQYDTYKMAAFAGGISAVLIAMSAAMWAFSKLGIRGAFFGAAGIGVATATLVAFGLGLTAIIRLIETYVNPDLVRDIEHANGIISKIGEGLGIFFGSIAGGFVTGATENMSFASLGTELSNFVTNLDPFIDKVKNVKEDVKTGAKNLADAVTSMTGAGFMASLTKIISNEDGMTTLASGLGELGKGLVAYSTAVTGEDGVNKNAVIESSAALKALGEAAGKIPNAGGALAVLVGDNTIDDFSNRLEILGKGLVSYSTSLKDVDTSKIESGTKIIESLAIAAAKIPNAGGLVSLIVGDNTLDTFGKGLQVLGGGLAIYSQEVSTIDDNAEAKSTIAMTLAGHIVSLSEKMGSFNALTLVSLNSLGSIATGLGSGLFLYAAAVSFINDGAAAKSAIAKSLAEDVIALAQTIDKGFSNGSWPDTTDFGEDAAALGAQLFLYGSGLDDLKAAHVLKSKMAVLLAQDVASIASNITQATGLEGLEDATEKLRKMGTAIGVYSKNIKSVDAGEADAKHAWELIRALVLNIPAGLQEQMSTVPTQTDLDTFAGQVAALGGAIVSFANSTTNITEQSVKGGTDALKLLAEMANKIPKTGGLFGFLAGNRDYTKFSGGLINMGDAVAKFSGSVKDISLFNAAKGSIALNMLAEMAQKVPKEEGFWQRITGFTGYASFSQGIISMGNALGAFSTAVKDVDSGDVQKAKDSLDILAALASKEIPKTGGLWQLLTGEVGYENFSNGVTQMGGALATFDKELGDKGVDEKRLLSGIRGLTWIINALNKIQPEAISTSTGQGMFDRILTILADLPTSLKTASDTLDSVNWDILGRMMTVINSVMSMGDQWASSNAAEGMANVRETLTAMTTSPTGSGWMDNIPAIASQLAQAFVANLTGTFDEYEGNIKIAAGYLGQAAYEGASAWEGDFHTIGYNFCAGLASGIYSGENMVWIAAHYVANEARIAAMNALGEHSPSKEMFKVGMYADMGLANGLTDYASLVKQAAGESAEGALSETGSVIAKVSAMLAQNTDTTPTIRPVLDLTDITTGVAAMNGMLPGTFGMKVGNIFPTTSAIRASSIGELETRSDSTEVVNAIYSLGDRLDMLEETMAGMQVVLDTGAAVGGLAPKMNKEFGNQALLDERNI